MRSLGWQRLDDRLSHGFEPLARLLLRAEGVASSYIEGVRAPAELVAVAQLDDGTVDATSAWVADNLAVVDASLEHARSDAALTADDLHRWHARLMTHGSAARRERRTGGCRTGWGGSTPRQAAYVPPPPHHVATLMRDLQRVTNTSRLRPRPLPPWSMPSSRPSTPPATATAAWDGCSSAGCSSDGPESQCLPR